MARTRNLGGQSLNLNEGMCISGTLDSKVGEERLTLIVTGSTVMSGSSNQPTLEVYSNASGKYVATFDHDNSSSGHGILVASDGTGSGTRLFDAEADNDIKFRIRGDGRVGIGKVTSLPSAVLTVSSSDGDGDIAVAHKIQHIGDSDTYIEFDDDELHLAAGGRTFIKLEEASTDKLIINHSGLDIDVQIKGENDDNLIRTDAENDAIIFGASDTSGPDEKFFCSGTIGHRHASSGSIATFGGDLVVSGVMYALGGVSAGVVLGIAAGDTVNVSDEFYIGVNTGVGSGASAINLPGITSIGSGRIIWVADVGGQANTKNIVINVGNSTMDRITGDAGADTSYTQDGQGDLNAWISYYDPSANGSTVFHQWFKLIS